MTITLVATSHGSGVPAARTSITALVDAVRELTRMEVREAFVDVQEPAVARVVEEVGGPAVVVPLLLAPGFHVHVDIAQAVDRPTVVASSTLGPDPRLTRVMLSRLAETGVTRDDIVVLGAAGSTDARARQSVDAAARMLGAAWGAPVPVGYVGGSGSPIDEIVSDVSHKGRRVVVASYLMAPGFFYDKLLRCGAEVVTRPLLDGHDVDPDMVSLVLDRFAEGASVLERASAWSTTRA